MSTPETGTMIEGVGDELLHLLGLFLVVAIPLFVAYHNRVRLIGNGAIHPDHVAHVEHTRAHLGHGPGPAREGNDPGQDSRPSEGTDNATTNGLAAGQGDGGPPRRYNADAVCPICLQEKECTAETNCGHVFCGNCLIAYWRHGAWLGAINCPVCRQMVTIILPVFTVEEQNSDEGSRVTAEIRDYNRRFSGEPRPFMDYIYDLPTLLRHASREFFTFHGVVWMFRLRIVVCFFAALLYLISPLDIIPEAIFGVLGFFDDIFVVLILAVYVSVIYRGIVAQRMMGD